MNYVPLISDKPSLALSSALWSPNSSKTFDAGSYLLVLGFHTLPSPIKPKPMWAKGTRSPDAPTLP